MRSMALVLIVAVAATAGCDKAKKMAGAAGAAAKTAVGAAGDAAQKMKDDLAKTTKEVTEKIDTDGALFLSVGADVELDACYGKFIPGIAGRRGLLQIRTYTEANATDYPAAFFHIPVDVASATDLKSEKLEGRVFLQDAQGIIWDNVDQPPVTFSVVDHENDQLKLKVDNGQLRNASTGDQVPLSGSATVVMK